MQNIKLHIVTALAEEARPIIHHFRLKRRHDIHPFPVYENNETQLIVAGIGKLQAAAATGYLAGMNCHNRQAAWLNLGVAGAGDFEVGEFVLAHTISDQQTNQAFYPTLWFKHEFKTAPLLSVAKPAVCYSGDTLFDMEGSGFYSAAMNVGTSELVHCCKIVSDNRRASIDFISPKAVVGWVEQNLDNLQYMMNRLIEGVNELIGDNKFKQDAERIKMKYHFTTSQQSQLEFALQKWFAMGNESFFDTLDFSAIKNAKALLHELDARLNRLPVNY